MLQNESKWVEKIRNDFPILNRKVNNNPLIYFDNGATTQKPNQVIQCITNYYTNYNSNIHRGVHSLSREASEAFENSRNHVAQFFGVKNTQQIVFTSGTTASINLVVNSLADNVLKQGDEIILSTYEHHSNILPWQLWAQKNNGSLKVIPLKSDHTLDLDQLENMISPKTKVISVAHVSNTLGIISDIQRIKEIALKYNLILFIDGAQSAPHMQIDLQKIAPDFFACSAHKMYGPTGTGMLYMSEKWLQELPVSGPGGGTIKSVSFEQTEYAEGALRFEAGTPHISGVIAFGEAVNYMNSIGVAEISKHENELTIYAQNKLKEINEVELYGIADEKAGVISFNVKNVHPFDVGSILDKYGIAVRTGHHCTQPLMKNLGIPGTVRISFAAYNQNNEIDFFIEKLKKAISMLAP
ncbi:MAG: cysteine desulfurase [Sphingobacteriaceae bacterium]|nr:cysteine desulfurase [Sphingobacteriaceae bacterium]